MKATILNLALAATLTTGAVAQPHHHGHHQLHKKGSPVEKREYETTYVPATVTQYMLGDDEVSADEAQAGIDKGLYVVVGETTPTFTTPSVAAATPSSTSKEDAVFIQKVSSTSSSTSIVAPTTTSSQAEVATTKASSSSSDSYSTGTGVDADFPDGEIDCDSFPSDYGAVALDYLDFGGFSGIQYTPNYSLGDLAISFIETAVGIPTSKKGFYSYACPEGYVKSQWPESQGNTGQSIGGLYCNGNGKLELTRGDVSKKLCEKGVGGVEIVNKMSEGTSFCRTDYPGTENMVIPVDVTAGSTRELANVNSNNYYEWQGKLTTLQYYVNKAGVTPEQGCRWVCEEDADGCGDKAPIVVGVGQTDGTTYLSVFPNSAVSSATLDYNIDITGDVSIKCSYHVGEGFSTSDQGCTTAITAGGTATITLSKA
ncbi:beta-glucosidase-domain-containing protein [Xylariaceae sp. FL0016]|nr:beta-glucosidase-domain-containing protein [Xylariaceae sp. FL0016]